MTLTDVFSGIASAINGKGISGSMKPTEMADKISLINNDIITNVDRTNRIIKFSTGSYGLLGSNGLIPLNSNNVNDKLTPFSTIKTEWRICVKFKIHSIGSGETVILRPVDSSYGYGLPVIAFNPSKYSYSGFSNFPRNNTSWGTSLGFGALGTVYLLDKWYYAVVSWNNINNKFVLSTYNEDGSLKESKNSTESIITYTNTKYHMFACGAGSQTGYSNSDIDYSETFIELNNQVVWGKTNSKTENMGFYNE